MYFSICRPDEVRAKAQQELAPRAALREYTSNDVLPLHLRHPCWLCSCRDILGVPGFRFGIQPV
eukprot:5815596-Amphidinium_carterae.1